MSNPLAGFLVGLQQGFLSAIPWAAPASVGAAGTLGAAQGTGATSWAQLDQGRFAPTLGTVGAGVATGASWTARVAGVAIGLAPIVVPVALVGVGVFALVVVYKVATNPDTPGAIGAVARAVRK